MKYSIVNRNKYSIAYRKKNSSVVRKKYSRVIRLSDGRTGCCCVLHPTSCTLQVCIGAVCVFVLGMPHPALCVFFAGAPTTTTTLYAWAVCMSVRVCANTMLPLTGIACLYAQDPWSSQTAQILRRRCRFPPFPAATNRALCGERLA